MLYAPSPNLFNFWQTSCIIVIQKIFSLASFFFFSGIFLPQSLHFASFTSFVCISPVDTSTMSTSKIGNELLSKALTKARYAHQCDFLNQCLHNKVIPKGLNIGLKVNFPGNPSLRVQTRAQGILRKYWHNELAPGPVPIPCWKLRLLLRQTEGPVGGFNWCWRKSKCAFFCQAPNQKRGDTLA